MMMMRMTMMMMMTRMTLIDADLCLLLLLLLLTHAHIAVDLPVPSSHTCGVLWSQEHSTCSAVVVSALPSCSHHQSLPLLQISWP